MFVPQQAILLIVDMQGKLAKLVQDSRRVIQKNRHLIQACTFLNIPVLISEQMPEKIGATIEEIRRFFKDGSFIPKKSFSCCGEEAFLRQLEEHKRHQVIVSGIETHVCVYQTVRELLEQSYQVQVVADAVSSRQAENKTLALDRMARLGAQITSTEMLLMELVRTAEHPKFKEILGLK